MVLPSLRCSCYKVESTLGFCLFTNFTVSGILLQPCKTNYGNSDKNV